MKRPILLLFLLSLLLYGCRASENAQVQEITVRPENTSAIPSASPKPTPKLVATPIVPTPAPTPVYRTMTPMNDEIDAPDSSTIPVGVAYPNERYIYEKHFVEMRGLGIMGGYTDGAFYEWLQYRFGNPPLQGMDFVDKYGIADDEGENDKKASDTSTNLIKSGQEFFLYGADGSKYRGTTKGKVGFNWDEVSYIEFDYRLDQKKIPLGYYVAVFGKWDAMPRKPKVVDENGSMEVDLDGDGTVDFIRVLETEDNHLLVAVEIGGNLYQLDRRDIVWTQYDLYQYGKEEQPVEYVLVFPVDVNGDGVMEVALFGASDTGQGGRIFSITKDKAVEVLMWCTVS